MPKKGEQWTPEQRAKILASRAKAATEEAPVRQPLKAIPQSPRGAARWQMRAGNRWDDAIDIPEGSNPLHIGVEEVPEGMDLMWVTSEVYGQPQQRHRANFENTGWTPVHPEDFDGLFEGRWAPKGTTGEINHGGLVLMTKPMELVLKAKRREQTRARQQVQIKEQQWRSGELSNVMGADHPSAQRFNHVNRSVERIAVPQDD